jgi:hypothetical protein
MAGISEITWSTIKSVSAPIAGVSLALGLSVWSSALLPQESAFQIVYNSDGTAKADYVVTHHDGEVERCSSFFKTTLANSYRVQMRPDITSCTPVARQNSSQIN